MEAIKFYSPNGEFGWLSNFSAHPVLGAKTCEHYFQSAKFRYTDPEWADKILAAETPAKAKAMAKSLLRAVTRESLTPSAGFKVY